MASLNEPVPDAVVVIPALDEEKNLPLVLRDIPPGFPVIVVDNGSTDRTAEVARAEGAEVIDEPRRGYGQACLTGIARAREMKARVVVILDGDHSFYPSEMSTLIEPILRGEADLVLGDRTRLAAPGALTSTQHHGNRLATFLIERVTGHHYRDMGPFRAVRTDALERMGMVDENFGWNVEMQIKAVRFGLRIAEIDVRCRPRPHGRSKISGSLRGSIRAGTKILYSTWRYRR